MPFEFLGPYRIGEMIGRGGMGTVYRGAHVKTAEPVAVKLIAAHVADDPQFRRRFASEVETLKRLKHRNIVRLIGYGEQHGQLFYSMELVEGESLQQKLRREKRLAWPLVLEMAIDVCAALKHAHDFGVYHRDLKLANLLIANDGTVKLVDFGIAKLFGSQDHTAAGSILGTAEYMAPEQADGRPITPRTDLYALGNVLYACFSGRPPFAGRTLTAALEALRGEQPVRIDAIDPDLPTEIAELIHDLLEKQPEDRPPTALAVMNRMKAIRAGLTRLASEAVLETDTPEDDIPEADTLGPPAIEQTRGGGRRDERPTAASIGGKTVPQFGEGATAAAAPAREQLTLKETVLSGAGITDASQAEAPTSKRTHFRTVQDQERQGDLWQQQHDEEPAGRFWHVLSITALTVALIVGAGIVLWTLTPPNADRLYASVMAAAERGDTAELLRQGNQFLRLFPADPRSADLAEQVEDAEAQRVLGRLRAAALRAGGADRLVPAENAFLSAMDNLSHDPRGTHARLQHWLAVYGHEPASGEQEPAAAGRQHDSNRSLATQDDSGGSADFLARRTVPHSRLIRAVELALQQGAAAERVAEDPRVAELKQRMQWGEQHLPAEQQENLLRGIIALFGDQPWAEPAVQLAQQRLAELPE